MAATQKNGAEIEKALALNHVPWCEEYEKMISGMLYAQPPSPSKPLLCKLIKSTATQPSPRT
jgi:hypothetical protein